MRAFAESLKISQIAFAFEVALQKRWWGAHIACPSVPRRVRLRRWPPQQVFAILRS